MANLLLILLTLFAALILVVKLTEKFAKPLKPEEAQKLSTIIVFLMGALLVASGISFLVL